jgi:type IV pilus assembly protein PilM
MRFLTRLVDRVLPFQPPIAGLDISDRAVKLLVLESGRDGLQLKAWSEKEYPRGVVEEGLIRDAGLLAKAIGEAWRDLGLSAKERWAVASIPEDHVFIRLVTLPRMPEEELKRAVELEVEATIPLPVNEVATDWIALHAPLNEGKEHHDVILSAAPKKVISDILAVCEAAQVRVAALEPESHAFSRVVASHGAEHAQESLLAVDIGAASTRVALVVGGIVEFSTALGVSGEMMTRLITEARHIDAAEAETFKRHVGLEGGTTGRAVFSILEPALKELTRELREAVRYWEEHIKHRHGATGAVSRIVLTGGGANLKGLAEFISFHVGVRALSADPWAILQSRMETSGGIRVSSSFRHPTTSFEPLRYATALGLALRGAVIDPLL